MPTSHHNLSSVSQSSTPSSRPTLSHHPVRIAVQIHGIGAISVGHVSSARQHNAYRTTTYDYPRQITACHCALGCQAIVSLRGLFGVVVLWEEYLGKQQDVCMTKKLDPGPAVCMLKRAGISDIGTGDEHRKIKGWGATFMENHVGISSRIAGNLTSSCNPDQNIDHVYTRMYVRATFNHAPYKW
jgi:hypothetical protein